MVQVAPIKLQVGPKVLWFDPAGLDIACGDSVIVSTERGHEFGYATSDIIDVSKELVAGLKSPLKPVLRKATPEDEELLIELEQRGEEALTVFKRLAQETHTDMHPVAVEFLFDGDKAVFFFESEERVDFRELVRRLAAEFHVRVDMRQIGVRDAAGMIGGLGHCGQELCCKRMGGEFNPVTIRMAKEQGLSLNPQKISGCCGRLMCCLRYEFDTYKEFNSRAPKLNAKVEVPGGIAKVTDVSMPTETIALRLEDGKTIRVPLSEFEEPEEGRRPHVISEEVFERYTQESSLEKLGTGIFESSTNFTGEDALADPSRKPKGRGKDQKREERESSSSRSRKSSSRKPRRRTRDGQETKAASPSASRSAKQQERSGKQEPKSTEEQRRSRRAAADSRQKESSASGRPASSHRKRRRRSSGEGSKAAQPQSQERSTRRSQSDSTDQPQRKGPRPGQKSSGLRAPEQGSAGSTRPSKPQGASPSKKQDAKGSAQRSTEGARRSSGDHRRPRRRRGAGQEGSTNASE
ncbi:MAG: regulatory iron-sulfur-containing complex subunit RicT [Coriobacteriia bacterium]|nr:regulatory iron-sulfur-containing complex subunit RicT [Coriobacteriia bacterium]